MKDEFNEGEDIWIVFDARNHVEICKYSYEHSSHARIVDESYTERYIFKTEFGAVSKMIELREAELKVNQTYIDELKSRQKKLWGMVKDES